ncbi:MAG: sucrase ferredoxin [Actinomycetota bacterium]|nr:sucrase ferredoxin [Actinomycetota bacterium]
MTAAERLPCSTVSLAAGESQAGTASRYRHWLLIEQPGRWGHDALVDSGFPAEVGVRLRDAGRASHVRVLLIKNRDRPPASRRRCFVAFTGRRERRLATFEVDDPAELRDLDLAAAAADRFRGIGEPVEGPLFLACTHGKHDPCCARLGAPLYRSVADAESARAWEATHVGGDRFAGNLVCFPHGMYFGRVGPGDGPAVAAAYARGNVELDFYRGRSCLPPAAQAAEHHLRSELGLLGVDDVVAARERTEGDEVVVDLDTSAGPRTVWVRVDHLDERPLTCKASVAHRPRRYAVTAVE